VNQHALFFDIRRRAHDAREVLEFLDIRAPVRNPSFEARNRRVRRQAQDPRPQHFLETIHDREHHDQHCDP